MTLNIKINRSRMILGTRSFAAVLSLLILATACTQNDSDPVSTAPGPAESAASIDLPTLPVGEVMDFGITPAVPNGDLTPELLASLDIIFGDELADGLFIGDELEALETLKSS
ncbi:MAG: hypothetical protein O6949_04635, partial [Chloroflexi bacterium]|nr:hypothetical protein [Chloroflexota bacterium]